MAAWPTVADLEAWMGGNSLSGAKVQAAELALDSAIEWVAERCDLYQRDEVDEYLLDEDDEKVLASSIPAPVAQAVLLYAAKFYRRKDTPDGVAGMSPGEVGVIRTGRFDSDAESLLGPYTMFTIG